MSDPFKLDTCEGHGVILTIDTAGLQDDDLPTLNLRADGTLEVSIPMTNGWAATLLELLEAEIGEWKRERDSVLAEFNAGADLHSVAAIHWRLDHPEDEGLDPLDPKRSDYAETLRHLADVSRKAERENG